MALTPAQIAEYREHGLVIVPNILSDADLQPVIDYLDAWVDERAREFLAAGKITDACEGLDYTRRLAALHAQCAEISRGIDIMECRGEAIYRFLHCPALVDAAASLVGQEVAINPIQHLRAKMPAANRLASGLETDVPWHQDVAVTWEEADATEIVTCWLPLVDASEANGCMHIIPDVWKRGYLMHQAEGGTTIRQEAFPTDVPPVVGNCPKGGVVFMNKYTPHKGLSNKSNTVRWTFDIRYQPTGQPSGRPFWPTFVTRSLAHPDSVHRDYADWCRQWDDALVKSRGYGWHRTTPLDKRVPASASAATK